MTAVVSIKHPSPRFEGQTKTKLDNQDASKATGKITGEEIVHYFDRNLETLKQVLSCAERSAKIRKTEEKAKTNMLTRQKYSFDSNGKLANCENAIRPDVRSLSSRVIPRVDPRKRRETEVFRQSCRSAARS